MPQTICCILCRGTVLFAKENGKEKFETHMNHEHAALFDLDFLLAASFMGIEDKNIITKSIQEKYHQQLFGVSGSRILDEVSVSNIVQDISRVIKASNNENDDDEIVIVDSHSTVDKDIIECHSEEKKVSAQRCRICGENFPSKRNYLHHIKKFGTNCNKMVVGGQQAFPCDKCEASFAQFGSLICHRKEYHGMVNKRHGDPSSDIQVVDISEPKNNRIPNSKNAEATGLRVENFSKLAKHDVQKQSLTQPVDPSIALESNYNPPPVVEPGKRAEGKTPTEIAEIKFRNEQTKINRVMVCHVNREETEDVIIEENDDYESMAGIMEACLEVKLAVKEDENELVAETNKVKVSDELEIDKRKSNVKLKRNNADLRSKGLIFNISDDTQKAELSKELKYLDSKLNQQLSKSEPALPREKEIVSPEPFETLPPIDVTSSKYFQAHKWTIAHNSVALSAFSICDPNLPEGWKIKENKWRRSGSRTEIKRRYLTPDLKTLKSPLAVLEYMRLSGTNTAEEILDVSKYLNVTQKRLKEYLEFYVNSENSFDLGKRTERILEFRCKVCLRIFPSQRRQMEHAKKWASNCVTLKRTLDVKFLCDSCNAPFAYRMQLQNHKKRRHQIITIEESSAEIENLQIDPSIDCDKNGDLKPMLKKAKIEDRTVGIKDPTYSSEFFIANSKTISNSPQSSATDFNLTDPALPSGWRVREFQWTRKNGNVDRKRFYLTPDLKVLKTQLAVLEYMRVHGFDLESIVKVAKHFNMSSKTLDQYFLAYIKTTKKYN